jgi:hypothetical protein
VGCSGSRGPENCWAFLKGEGCLAVEGPDTAAKGCWDERNLMLMEGWNIGL